MMLKGAAAGPVGRRRFCSQFCSVFTLTPVKERGWIAQFGRESIYYVTIMSKYLVLYRSEGALTGPSVSEMLAKTTQEQLAAGMGAWGAWHEKCGGAIVDLGAPLDHSTTVAEGAGTPGKTSITGYTLLEAGSLDEAVTLMKDHPHFQMPGASVQILECVAMPGI
jgi:hypothetical protein